jgi:hypothetical protein
MAGHPPRPTASGLREALLKALKVINIKAEGSKFGLFANFLSDASEQTALNYYEHLGMYEFRNENNDFMYMQDNEGHDVAKFMEGDISTVLQKIGIVQHRASIVDAGAYYAIKCQIRRCRWE